MFATRVADPRLQAQLGARQLALIDYLSKHQGVTPGTKEDRMKAQAEYIAEAQKASGPSPYGELRSSLQEQLGSTGKERNLDEAAAYFEAIPEILQGNSGLRGLAAGTAKVGSGLAKAAKNEKLAKERDNLAVHKQEVTTYANGSKTITNVAEIPATANAPGRPNVRPVAPDEIFQNQLRAESGNRQTDRNGQVITSNKGAMGIAQIMPRTAMQPGYGVPDIFTLAEQRGIPVTDRSEATARQLLANKDLNQDFGQQYSSAMRQRFGDNAGVAGYNMGPGAVEKNMRRNQGQFNIAQAPEETQGYLGKVMRGVGNVVNAVIPSAQAAPAPRNVPQAFPEEGVAVATGP